MSDRVKIALRMPPAMHMRLCNRVGAYGGTMAEKILEITNAWLDEQDLEEKIREQVLRERIEREQQYGSNSKSRERGGL